MTGMKYTLATLGGSFLDFSLTNQELSSGFNAGEDGFIEHSSVIIPDDGSLAMQLRSPSRGSRHRSAMRLLLTH